MEPKKQILVVDDDPKVARFIQTELQHNYYACAVEHTGGRAIDRIAQEPFSLVILDLMLPDVDGLIVCEHIRKFTSVPILILSAKDDYDTKTKLLDMGANDYVTKPFNSRELLARVNVLLRSIYNPLRIENVLRLQDIVLYVDRHEVVVGNTRLLLTKTEFKMLAFLIKNKNIVLPRVTIFESVWGEAYLGNTNIVDVYARSIRNKLNDREPTGQRKYIKTVRGVGYVAYE